MICGFHGNLPGCIYRKIKHLFQIRLVSSWSLTFIGTFCFSFGIWERKYLVGQCWGKQRCPSCQHHHETNFCGTCYLSGSLCCNCHLGSAKIPMSTQRGALLIIEIKYIYIYNYTCHLESKWRSPLPLVLVYHGPSSFATFWELLPSNCPSIESKIHGSLEIREG